MIHMKNCCIAPFMAKICERNVWHSSFVHCRWPEFIPDTIKNLHSHQFDTKCCSLGSIECICICASVIKSKLFLYLSLSLSLSHSSFSVFLVFAALINIIVRWPTEMNGLHRGHVAIVISDHSVYGMHSLIRCWIGRCFFFVVLLF